MVIIMTMMIHGDEDGDGARVSANLRHKLANNDENSLKNRLMNPSCANDRNSPPPVLPLLGFPRRPLLLCLRLPSPALFVVYRPRAGKDRRTMGGRGACLKWCGSKGDLLRA